MWSPSTTSSRARGAAHCAGHHNRPPLKSTPGIAHLRLDRAATGGTLPPNVSARLGGMEMIKKVRWNVVGPVLAIVVLALTWGRYNLSPVVVVLVALVLCAAVLAAVHHAEVVAHVVGEPYVSLVLAVAVTVIEVALITTLMIPGGDGSASVE